MITAVYAAHTTLIVIHPKTISITACFNSGVAALMINKKCCRILTVKKFRRNFRRERLTRGRGGEGTRG
jgi:hypothetical protein